MESWTEVPGIDPDRDGVYSFDEVFGSVARLWHEIDEQLVDELTDELWHLEQTRCQRQPQERLVGMLLERLWTRFERREIDAYRMLVEAFSYGRAFEHLNEPEAE